MRENIVVRLRSMNEKAPKPRFFEEPKPCDAQRCSLCHDLQYSYLKPFRFYECASSHTAIIYCTGLGRCAMVQQHRRPSDGIESLPSCGPNHWIVDSCSFGVLQSDECLPAPQLTLTACDKEAIPIRVEASDKAQFDRGYGPKCLDRQQAHLNPSCQPARR